MSFCSIILIEILVPTENIIRKKYTINSRSLAYYTYHCIISVIIIIRCMVHPNLSIAFEFFFSFFSFSLSPRLLFNYTISLSSLPSESRTASSTNSGGPMNDKSAGSVTRALNKPTNKIMAYMEKKYF
jgi:hypothetical protein